MQFSMVDVVSVFFLSVNHYPREFNILQKKTKNKKNLTIWAQHDKTLQETIAFPDKRKSLLVIQIYIGDAFEIKLDDLKPIKQSQEELCVSKGS